jgi:hypothetical protein
VYRSYEECMDRFKARALIVAFTVLGSPTIAADFRGSELGGSCTLISEHEIALGSTELGDPKLVNQRRFSGRAFNRDVFVTYLCKDGLLALVDLRVAPHVYDDAASDFDDLYTGLTTMYGAPYLENSLDQKVLAEAQLPRAGGKPSGYQAMWKGAGFHVSLALHAVADRAGSNWLAFAVFTSEVR